MAFDIKKISDHGTGHPVVARLKVQTHDLLQWADLPKNRQDDVAAIYFALADRLLKCHEVYGRLTVALKAALDEIRPSSDPRIRNVPHVIGLQGEVETFLYESKNFLRDLLGIVEIFFGKHLDEASAFYDAKGKGDGKLVEWAKSLFGETDPFTEMLVTEQDWVGELIRKRNAVEHPGGNSGTLHVENFTPLTDGRFLGPTWHRDQNPPKGVFPDLETYLDNLLTLAEEMLVWCIHHKTQHKIIQFVETPEADRRPDCPIRITVTLDHSKLGPPVPAESPERPDSH